MAAQSKHLQPKVLQDAPNGMLEGSRHSRSTTSGPSDQSSRPVCATLVQDLHKEDAAPAGGCRKVLELF